MKTCQRQWEHRLRLLEKLNALMPSTCYSIRRANEIVSRIAREMQLEVLKF